MAKQKYRRFKGAAGTGEPGASPGDAPVLPEATSATPAAEAVAGVPAPAAPFTSGIAAWGRRLMALLSAGSTRPPLFRKIDWWTFWGTTALTLLTYLITLAPDLTLEDCGELAVASYYAGVPHAPGYPIWTLYTFVFANLLPIANVAWRVAVSSAVAAALANGLLGLIVSRGSSMILEGIPWLKDIDRRREDAICVVSGTVAALLIGFNGFMWSQAVIVEVYTLSVLSLVGVLVCLLHWVYTPEQKRYLYLAAFLFGICFNNHQTLIVAAMGLEVLVAMTRPRLGRDAFLINSLVFVLGLILMSLELFTAFDDNKVLLRIYYAVGLGSLGAFAWLTHKTGGLLAYEARPGHTGCQWLNTLSLGLLGRPGKRYVGPLSEWLPVLITFLAWIVAAQFYFIMPLLSVSNPPMNWAYPRTFDGFWHAFSRGQYERTNPTDIFHDPWRFIMQLAMYFEGAAEEFHVVFLLLALVPFFFYTQMQQRERAWIIGNTAIYACLAFLLLILLNPTPDKQSRDLTRVFFTASHVVIAMFTGFGLTLISAMLLKFYTQVRTTVWAGGAVAGAFSLYWLAARLLEAYGDPELGVAGLGTLWSGFWGTLAHFSFTRPVFVVLAATFVLVLTLTFMGLVLYHRERLNPAIFLGCFALIPLYSVISHWPENEQRGHVFGFWFGHDMFTPPFDVYPEMARNAILFGGTDPGRFCPTYMIFCESFIKPSRRRDPEFDRRDVYIITQNALADNTYLNYIRAHYNRSTQEDPPFLRDAVMFVSDMLLGKEERELKAQGKLYKTGFLARSVASLTNIVAPFDRLYLGYGAAVEARRRGYGLYPEKEIYTPSPLDLQDCFDAYMADAQRRYFHDQQNPTAPRQVKPGEEFHELPGGRIQVAGQVAVMAINALLTKVIFDQNPDHEFYVEESFPLEWMYPHLSPYGIIMKINREPVGEFTQEMLDRDHEFWKRYSARLCGDWVDHDTPIADLCDFVTRVYRQGNLRGYTGDPKFVRDSDAQKSFAKLRGSIGGLYDWRIRNTTDPDERARLTREAEFAFKQSFAFCPYSPESVSRYVQLLAGLNRMEDALLLAETAFKFDVESGYLRTVIDQLRTFQQNAMTVEQVQGALAGYEKTYRDQPTNQETALQLALAYAQVNRTNEAFRVLDEIVERPEASVEILIAVADAYVKIGQYGRSAKALRKLVALMPDQPELWYDLAGAQVYTGQNAEAIASLSTCLTLNRQRLATNAEAVDLQKLAASDPRFQPLRSLPEFQKLVARPR